MVPLPPVNKTMDSNQKHETSRGLVTLPDNRPGNLVTSKQPRRLKATARVSLTSKHECSIVII